MYVYAPYRKEVQGYTKNLGVNGGGNGLFTDDGTVWIGLF